MFDREFIGKYADRTSMMFLPYMALGRLKEAAKYSHGVWEPFADTFGRFQSFEKLNMFTTIFVLPISVISCMFRPK